MSRFTIICFFETKYSYKQLRGGGGFLIYFFLFTFPSLNADLNTKKAPKSKHQKKALYLDRFTMALKSHWESFISQHITLEDISRRVLMPEMGRRCRKYFD